MFAIRFMSSCSESSAINVLYKYLKVDSPKSTLIGIPDLEYKRHEDFQFLIIIKGCRLFFARSVFVFGSKRQKFKNLKNLCVLYIDL